MQLVSRTGAAQRLAAVAEEFLGGALPFRLRAWDGSEAGPSGAPLVVLRSRTALRRLLWQPGELGLADAYISGDLEVVGDPADALAALWQAARARGLSRPRLTARQWAEAAALLVRLGAVGPPPRPPGRRARQGGTLHSVARDRSAISHHYDLSNDFYELLLDETMAYSCGYWRQLPGTEGYGPAQSQYDKLDLICRKLALRPGARLLDMGCGWGSLTVHAAEHFQAQVTAVTLSAEQARHTRERVRARGLEDRVRVRHCHYRDLPDGGFDAAATVEMGEHVGADAYPHFAARLRHALAPRGRLLVQQMSRGADAPGGGPFIETYIAPDMHMRPLGETVALLEEAGLEVRAATSLREHYVHTIDAWRDTLEAHWDAATALVGAPTARLWRLYLAGGRLAFAERRMGVDQILAVRPDEDGRSGLGANPLGGHEGTWGTWS
nr:cyclopropane-fatty-acyl-phospholipid synthase family protein [Streptomyces sp. AA1529]